MTVEVQEEVKIKEMNENYQKPLIIQRADPFIYKHEDGYYYFIASVPSYDRIELRRSRTIAGLAYATPRTIWRKHETGEMSKLIWAPEIHYIAGKWYIYFAATHTEEIIDGLFTHRMYCLECEAQDPMVDENWHEKGQVVSHLDTFCLDATVFEHNNHLYYVWAQKDNAIEGNSNLYIAEMTNPWTLKTEPVMLTKPEFAWECKGFKVNEGPAVLMRNGKIFITYSASATDENYCMGMIYADLESDLLKRENWTKVTEPVFQSDLSTQQYGPGHNSFTIAEDGETDILVYHCRDYTEIKGDPLYDPNRHTKVQAFGWGNDGFPIFGKPLPYLND
ncbi:TPA: family 43 glycosylhydrolase [Enterococcus faecium]